MTLVTERTQLVSRPPSNARVSPTVVALAALAALVPIVAGATGCASSAPVDAPELGATANPIIGGAADSTHDAVVAIYGQQGAQAGACTGTIVKTVGKVGYVLTAAHCVTIPPSIVFMGPDYNSASAKRFAVLDYAAHPSYNGDVASNYDVAVVRVLGVNSGTPVIPITASPDQLSLGTTLTSVGYGRTTPAGASGGDNTTRKNIRLAVQELDSTHIGYRFQSGNICQGDSGGPALRGTGTAERVVGIHSYVNGDCTQQAYSVRVTFSSVYTFIQQQLAKAPPAESCDSCTRAETSGDNPCAQKQAECFTDPECEKLAECQQKCSSATCVTDCENRHPRAIAKFNAAVYCTCGETVCKPLCFIECRSAPKCGFALPRDACGACTEGACCDAVGACAGDADCLLCLRAGASADPSCATNKLRKAVADCATTKCKTECASDPIVEGGQPTPGGPVGPDGKPVPAGAATTTTTTESCGCEVVGASPAPRAASLAALFGLALGLAGRRARRREGRPRG